MYRHCVFCASDLGRNEVVEAFPVGRRLAFDGHRGRLWVVCRHCERWNLTPLEERWEALDECERLFRETPLRMSSEQVGLARHREGLDLVRIGDPVRAEFASWRYGDQFGRRLRRHIGYGVAGGIAAGGLVVGSAGVLGAAAALQVGSFGLHAVNAFRGARHLLRPGIEIQRVEGAPIELRVQDLRTVKVRPGRPEGHDGAEVSGIAADANFHVKLDHRHGSAILVGADATRALRTTLPLLNRSGGSKKVVSKAVGAMEEAGGPIRFLEQVELQARREGMGYMAVGQLPAPLRLGVEMAAHEETEREALEGELHWLERAWKEAEEVAAIADDLALPDRVRRHLQELKTRLRR